MPSSEGPNGAKGAYGADETRWIFGWLDAHRRWRLYGAPYPPVPGGRSWELGDRLIAQADRWLQEALERHGASAPETKDDPRWRELEETISAAHGRRSEPELRAALREFCRYGLALIKQEETT